MGKKFAPLPFMLLWLAMLAYATYFSYLTLVRYAAFESRALDMGNLNQAIWNTANGNWFHLTNEPGTINRLSLHVEPIIIPISWLYWLHRGPETLLVLQACVVALGALPLFALARFTLKSEWMALLFALVFLLNPTIQAANWLEFHPLTLAPTLLIAAFFFLVIDRPGWFAFFAILAASCKEEIALLIFMIGLYAFLILRRRKLGLITMALSLFWALFAVLVIQNFFAEGNIHWGRYGYLGETPTQKVVTLLTKPRLCSPSCRRPTLGRYLLGAAAASRLYGLVGARNFAVDPALAGHQPAGRLCAHARGQYVDLCGANCALCADGGGGDGGMREIVTSNGRGWRGLSRSTWIKISLDPYP